MIYKSPAKINWFLHVLGKREDGFHEIVSPLHKVTLFDTIRFERSDNIVLNDKSKIDDNIILKAVTAVKKYCPGQELGVSIDLDKRIPVAAGLGGGSSDAATTIVALNELWTLGLSRKEMISIAGSIGSDVPFFIGEGFSIVKGRGEILRPQRIEQSYDLLLLNPGIEISSGWAYGNVDTYIDSIDEEKGVKEFIEGLNRKDFTILREYAFNSLEKPVFSRYPVLAELKRDLVAAGAELVLMSGSGSTVFGVFEREAYAMKAQQKFKRMWTAVVKTLQ